MLHSSTTFVLGLLAANQALILLILQGHRFYLTTHNTFNLFFYTQLAYTPNVKFYVKT